MSIIPSEVPVASPSPAPVAVAEPVPAAGLKPAHVAGGGFAGVVGAVVVAVCNHFGWHVSDVDAVLVGAAAVSAGVGVGHVIGSVGIKGAVKHFWRGNKA
jgi:uncharacterized membrane protein